MKSMNKLISTNFVILMEIEVNLHWINHWHLFSIVENSVVLFYTKTKNTMIFSKLTRFAWRNNSHIRQFSGKYQKALDKYPILMQAAQVRTIFLMQNVPTIKGAFWTKKVYLHFFKN